MNGDRRREMAIPAQSEVYDNRLCSVLLSALLPKTMLLAGRGYDAGWIRELARQQVGERSAETKSQRPDLLQSVSVSRTQFDRTVLQQDQAMSAYRDRYDIAANSLAFVKFASIPIWVRANESTL
jgi:hypothetical protein